MPPIPGPPPSDIFSASTALPLNSSCVIIGHDVWVDWPSILSVQMFLGFEIMGKPDDNGLHGGWGRQGPRLTLGLWGRGT